MNDRRSQQRARLAAAFWFAIMVAAFVVIALRA
jgi:hypothetical protein